jgi:small subunit ribosomal protein S16
LSVKIRMKRFGRTNRAFFRVAAVDSRKSRDGRVIEELGSYDPHGSDEDKMKLKRERIAYWLSVGAQPSEAMRPFLKKAGLIDGTGKPLPFSETAPVTLASVAPVAPVAPTVPVAEEIKLADDAETPAETPADDA